MHPTFPYFLKPKAAINALYLSMSFALQQAATAVVVFLMRGKVGAQLVDTVGQQCDLHFGTTGIALFQGKFLNDFGLFGHDGLSHDGFLFHFHFDHFFFDFFACIDDFFCHFYILLIFAKCWESRQRIELLGTRYLYLRYIITLFFCCQAFLFQFPKTFLSF